MEATASTHGFDPRELDLVGTKMVQAMRALHERRLTPATEKAVEKANGLIEQRKFAEAADAWDEIYFRGTVLEGHDFYGPGRTLGCEPMKDGSYKSICRIDPPVDLREGDMVHLWADITICVEKIEKVFYSELPYLLVQGKKRDSNEGNKLTAPWLSG